MLVIRKTVIMFLSLNINKKWIDFSQIVILSCLCVCEYKKVNYCTSGHAKK